jgi:GTP-binding protein YchF
MLEMGLVGLPNVGKSTLFNALTAGHAQVSNYPFTTIDSNVGVVAVPDARLERLAAAVEPQESTPAFVRFVDVAGLVEGASQGEGLGNRFLGDLRAVDALAHVLRCFESDQIAHVLGTVDPIRDAQLVETELLLADLELMGRILEKRRKVWQTDPKTRAAEQERFEGYEAALERGESLRTLSPDRAQRQELKALGLLTGRPLLYVANTGDGGEEWAHRLEAALEAPTLAISAEVEYELASLEPSERAEFQAELGYSTSGLERLAEISFGMLDLIRFYTVANEKLRAWSVKRDTPAAEAAGAVHSDMQEGFIRAQVAAAEDLVAAGSFHALHDLGKLHTVGRDYPVRDGDVVEFLFRAP